MRYPGISGIYNYSQNYDQLILLMCLSESTLRTLTHGHDAPEAEEQLMVSTKFENTFRLID